MGDRIAVIDTETTGLCPLEHRIWEAALLVYDLGRREVVAEHVWQIALSAEELAAADPVALEIGRFAERRAPAAEQVPPWLFAEQLCELTAGLPIVGANPSFDEERLRRLLWRCGLEPAWHYRPICVEVLAVGFLHGEQAGATRYALASGGLPPVLGVPEAAQVVPWRSQAVAEAMGVARPSEVAHTALGDCHWALSIWRAVFER